MERELEPRDRRCDVVVETLRARQVEDREAREKRQRWYRQTLEGDSGADSGEASDTSSLPTRLYKFRTKVPCRVTTEASALLEQIRKRFAGCTVSFQHVTSGQQALMVTGGGGTERKQIGRLEHCVETDPKLCNVLNHGLSVETDDESMLVLRFRYPQTSVRVSSGCSAEDLAPPTGMQVVQRSQEDGLELARYATDAKRSVDFVEIRPALDQRSAEKGSSPRLVWLTRPELEVMNSLESRDYESFYVRFKLELQAGIWSSLSGLLANSPGSQWYRGSCYTVVTEPDATVRKIHQRTIDDAGRSVDIGADRTYDAAPATDILLLYLESDLLADIAEIYFTIQSLGSSDSYSLKEEFFTVIRRFWANSQSLASRYGSDLASVVRMSQRAIPMPAQAPLLKQDWTNLRQSLVDRYGEGGRNVAVLRGNDLHRPVVGPLAWPFSAFPPGEINVGLRLVYRQEWTHLGVQRGDVICRGMRDAGCGMRDAGCGTRDAGRGTEPGCHSERSACPEERKRRGDESACNPVNGSFRTRPSGNKRRSVETTIEQRVASTSLSELVNDVAEATIATMKWARDFDGGIHTGVRGLAVTTDMGLESESRESSREITNRLSDLTLRLATEMHNQAIVRESAEPETSLDVASASDQGNRDDNVALTHVYSKLQSLYDVRTRPSEIQNIILVAEQLPTPAEIDLSWARQHDWILAKVLLDESFRDALNVIREDEQTRDGVNSNQHRFFEHLRANILHYQRAIWRQEDPQQRSMRYRKSGKKVPLEWRFELESGGALTIDELGDRLSATNVDGQFAAYSGGREADLDQVIDPSGPIGYYGNYVIYHMRPEFGSADVFSMLHFFKSPYLRPNVETGIPEVGDPSVGEERARRIALDTGGVVIDAIRNQEQNDPPNDLPEVLEGHELVLEGAPGLELLRVNGEGCGVRGAGRGTRDGCHSERSEESVFNPINVAFRIPSHPAPHTPRPADAWIVARDSRELKIGDHMIRPPSSAERTLEIAGGEPNESGAESVMFLPGEDGAQTHISGDSRAHHPEGNAGIEARPADVHAGRAHDPALVIQPSDGLIVTTAAGSRAAKRDERASRPGADESSPEIVVPLSEPEPAIIAAVYEESAINGRSSAAREEPNAEFVIFARNGEERTLRIGDGRALDKKAEPGIVANDDEAMVTSLLAGRPHESGAEWVIHRLGQERARVTSVADGRAHPHEQIVLAGGDDEWMTSLLAGSGVGRTHERVILGQEDEWLRPSLVAG